MSTIIRAAIALTALVAVIVALAAVVLFGFAAVVMPLLDLSGVPSTGNWIGRI